MLPAKVVLLELTVPWDSSDNFKAAYERKLTRYERLAGDLRQTGFYTINLEIGCRGVLNPRNSVVLVQDMVGKAQPREECRRQPR